MADLEELAGRVEQLPERSREMDALIDHAIGHDLEPRDTPKQRANWPQRKSGLTTPRYTASIDAAMTLVDPAWWLSMSGPMSPAAYGYSREDQRNCRAGFEMLGAPYFTGAHAPSGEGDPIGRFARAITAASLRARARTQGNPNG